jgi:predicted metal-dependent hydrolase
MSLINFTGQLYLAAFFLAWQDRSVLQIAFWRDFISFNFKRGFVGELLRSSLLYMRKGFHPNKILNDHLVSRGMETFNNL